MFAAVKPNVGNLSRMVALVALALGALAAEAIGKSYESVMVYSENFNGYKRHRLPTGAIQPETFAFGEGECFATFVANNESNDLSFVRVVGTLAKPLAERGYLAAPDANHADLLILVSWGVTEGTQNVIRQHIDLGDGRLSWTSVTGLNGARDVLNARLLGYAGKLQFAMDVPWFSVAQDIFDEIQENRYFVILQAFDFQLLRKEHRKKILWETRFSISEQGNDFGAELAGMARRASPYFGDGNGRLVRRAFPKAHVEVGTPVEVKDER